MSTYYSPMEPDLEARARQLVNAGFNAYVRSYLDLSNEKSPDIRMLSSRYRITYDSVESLRDLIPDDVPDSVRGPFNVWSRSVPIVLDRLSERSLAEAWSLPSSPLIVLDRYGEVDQVDFLAYVHEAAHDLLQSHYVGWIANALAMIRTDLSTTSTVAVTLALREASLSHLHPEMNPDVKTYFGIDRSFNQRERAQDYANQVWLPLRHRLSMSSGADKLDAVAVRLQALIDSLSSICRSVGEAFASWVELRSGKTASTRHTQTLQILLPYLEKLSEPSWGATAGFSPSATAPLRASREARFLASVDSVTARCFDLFDRLYREAPDPGVGETRVQWAANLATALPISSLDSNVVNGPISRIQGVVSRCVGDPVARLSIIARDPHRYLTDFNWDTLAANLDVLDSESGFRRPQNGQWSAETILQFALRMAESATGVESDPNDARRSPTRPEAIVMNLTERQPFQFPVVLLRPSKMVALDPLVALQAIPDLCTSLEASWQVMVDTQMRKK